MKIRRMRAEDLHFAFQCTLQEGWAGETLEVLKNLYTHDPRGCLIGEEAGRPGGICIGTSYGQAGFVGDLIVIPELRGRGYGKQLLNHCIDNLTARGTRNIYLDGDLAAVHIYEKRGFRKLGRSFRYRGTVAPQNHPDITAVQDEDFEEILAIDRTVFNADRSFFLRQLLSQHPQYSLVRRDADRVSGYLFARPGRKVISVGPWIELSESPVPAALLTQLATRTGPAPLRIGVLETNRRAITLIKSLPGLEEQEFCWRMVLGPGGDLEDTAKVFAIGSGSKG